MSSVIMKSTLTHLRSVYLWPKSKNTKTTTIPAFLTLFSGSFLFLGSLLNLIITTIKHQDNDVIANILNLTSQFGVMYFASLFLISREISVKIVNDLEDFCKFGKPPHFEKGNVELDKVARLFRAGLYAIIIMIFSWPGIYRGHCKQKICGIVAPVWLPFDYSTYPRKELIYAWQCYCCLVTYGAAGMISMFMLETMEHLVIKIQHLKMMLKVMIEETDSDSRYGVLRICVDYHNFIFRIGKDMNKSYRASLAVHVFVAGVLFGFIGHSIMENAYTLDLISLFLGWFFSLFVVCVGGQHLIDESQSVSLAVYNSRWYDLDSEFQKNLLPIMIRSQKPIVLYAGPFSFLSLLLILTILQTAYTYINLLKATS